MTLIGWVLFGLLVGIVARLLVPGRDPGGIVVSIGLGIVGALLGGFIGRAVGLYGHNEGAGFILAVVGAVILLMLYRMIAGRRRVA